MLPFRARGGPERDGNIQAQLAANLRTLPSAAEAIEAAKQIAEERASALQAARAEGQAAAEASAKLEETVRSLPVAEQFRVELEQRRLAGASRVPFACSGRAETPWPPRLSGKQWKPSSKQSAQRRTSLRPPSRAHKRV